MSDAIARGGNSDFHADAENPPDDLRDRIAAALRNMTGDLTYEAMADAAIRELDMRLPEPNDGEQWHVQDVGTVKVGNLQGIPSGVSMTTCCPNHSLVCTADEARAYAAAILAAANDADRLEGRR